MKEMTVKDVADELRLTPQAVRSWCRRGLLGTRLGGRWRISRDQLREFLLSGLPRSR